MISDLRFTPPPTPPQRGAEKSSAQKAYNYAVYLLGIRLRTEGELRERMKQKGYPLAIVSEVIDRLKDQRFLDDLRFAQVFLDNLKKYKNFGFYGIKKKMMEKRLPSNIVEQILSKGLPVEEELKIAKRFLRNYELGIMNYEGKQRTGQRLKSRGFRGEVIAKLIF